MTRYKGDDEPLVGGEGLTRTSDPQAQLWALVVTLPGTRPLKTTVLATSLDEAIRFSHNRHPHAIKVAEC